MSQAKQELNTQTRRERIWALGLSLISRAARLGMVLSIAVITGRAVMGDGVEPGWLMAFVSALVTLASSSVIAERLIAQAEHRAAKTVLSWYERFFSRSAVGEVAAFDPGDLVSRTTRHPELAAAATISLPIARSLSGLGAIMAAAMMAFLSWQAAVLLLLSLPVMIGFFITIGGMTKERAIAQEHELQNLSALFSDRVRTLPTIVANHANDRETERLETSLQAYKSRVQSVLGVAFLNSGVLDFFSSLSIAMLAIFLGLGHLGLASIPGFSDLSLSASLAILVLAPEFFAPLKRYAELYHRVAEGDAALDALDPILKTNTVKDQRLPAERFATRGLKLRFVGEIPDINLPDRGLVAVCGRSGAGKTALLRALAGIDPAVAGQIFRPEGTSAWVSTDSWLPQGCIRSLLGVQWRKVLHKVALDGDRRFADENSAIAMGGSDLSGGERLRLSLALAIASDAEIVFADEPTAKLDAASGAVVRDTLLTHAQNCLVITATHDRELAHLAVMRIDLQHREECAS